MLGTGPHSSYSILLELGLLQVLLSVPDSVRPLHSLAHFVYFHAQINDGGDFNGQLQNVMFVFVSDDDNAMNVQTTNVPSGCYCV